jgi:hypothetical protein
MHNRVNTHIEITHHQDLECGIIQGVEKEREREREKNQI